MAGRRTGESAELDGRALMRARKPGDEAGHGEQTGGGGVAGSGESLRAWSGRSLVAGSAREVTEEPVPGPGPQRSQGSRPVAHRRRVGATSPLRVGSISGTWCAGRRHQQILTERPRWPALFRNDAAGRRPARRSAKRPGMAAGKMGNPLNDAGRSTANGGAPKRPSLCRELSRRSVRKRGAIHFRAPGCY